MLIRKKTLNGDTKKYSIYPDIICESVAEINFTYLRKMGIKACFIDLDGTVVSRRMYNITNHTAEVLKNSGLDIYIATNRPKSRSLKNLLQDLSAKGVVHPVGWYGKPTKKYFKNGLKAHGLRPHEVVMIGDRYFQDITGANRSGMYSLLVNKIGPSHDVFDRCISWVEKRFTQRIAKNYNNVK